MMSDRANTPSLAAIGAPLEVSFEFFPPKTPEMEAALWRAVERLAPIRPRFVSVTYGAGGTTRERTHRTVARLVRETGLGVAAHLTCVGAEKSEVDVIARGYREAGVRHIVALRGDPPEGVSAYAPHSGGYGDAAELVAGLKRISDFEISVAAYPEIHPDAASSQADLENLKRKIDAGADRAITQFFFDPDVFLRFLERARANGIWVPIVPGILPVTNFRTVRRFAASCGAAVPAWLAHLFEGLDDDAESRKLIAATVAAEQCRQLRRAGVGEFHFYTLNRADLVFAICRVLGARAPAPSDGSRADRRMNDA